MNGFIALNDRTDIFKYKASKDQIAKFTIKTTDLREHYRFKLVSASTGETLIEENNITSGTKIIKNVSLKKGSYYITISSTDRTGKYSLAIKGVNVKKTAIKKINNVSNKWIKVTWGKLTNAVEYQVTVSTNSKFKSGNKTYKTSATSVAAPIKRGRKYYVRVRAKFTCGNRVFYSPWSKTKSIYIK